MKPALPCLSRRTFLSASTVAALATAAPATAAVMLRSGPIALVSNRAALPQDWRGQVVVLSGDYSGRLAQMHEALSMHGGRDVVLFLDGADSVLFDIANMDQRARVRPMLPVSGNRAAGAAA